MCTECGHINSHATMCPNGTPMVDEILADCTLCGAEVDEETTTYGICERCWTDYRNFDNALAFGATELGKDCVQINGFYAYVLTPDQIESALHQAVMDQKKFYYDFTVSTTNDFLSDDDGAFASWLKEQKNID